MTLTKLKRVASLRAGGTPTVQTERFWRQPPDGVPWVAIGDMSHGGLVRDTARRVSADGIADKRLPVGCPGTVLFAMYASLGAVAELAVKASWNQALLGIDPLHGLSERRFVRYWLEHLRPSLGALARSNTQDNLNAEQVANLDFPVVSVGTQRAIADYLDTETGRIDALISKKRRMIELLQERVGSIIFDGVTGRLTSSGVCTVSSGIDWLGSVPDHFGTPWLGAFHTAQLGKMLNAAAASGPEQYLYIKNTNVQWDSFDLEELPSMSFDAEDRRRCELRPGDLLVCEGGEVGRSAVWDLQSQIYFQKALHRVRPLTENVPRFLMYCLWAAANLNVFSVEGNQATIVHLTGEKLRSHRFPWPPLEEQKRIVSIIDSQRGRIDRAVTSMELQIERLAERRQALITAAVTGELAVSRVWHDLSRPAGAA